MKLIRKKISKTKTFFDKIRVSEKYIFVFRIRETLTDENSFFPVDIFDLEGNFLGSASLAALPLYISDQFIYSILYDEEDNLLLQKYQYKIIE